MIEEISSDGSMDVNSTVRRLSAAIKNGNFSDHARKSAIVWDVCNKRRHMQRTCFLDPDNPENRLFTKMKEMKMAAVQKSGTSDSASSSDKKRGRDKDEFAGVTERQ